MKLSARIVMSLAALSLSFSGVSMAAAAPAAESLASARVVEAPVVTTTKLPDATREPAVKAYLATLAPEARQIFIDTELPSVEVTTAQPLQPLDAAAKKSAESAAASGQPLAAYASGCWLNRYDSEHRSAAGVRTYSWYHIGEACSNGTRITSSKVYGGGAQVHAIGWDYLGQTNKGTYFTTAEARSFSQYGFKLTVTGAQVKTAYPCIRVYQNIDRRSASDAKCGVI